MTTPHSLEEELSTTEVAIRNKKPGVLIPNAIPNILSIGIDGILHIYQTKEASLEVQERTNPILVSQNRKASSLPKGQQCIHIPRYQFSIYLYNILDTLYISYTINIIDLIID